MCDGLVHFLEAIAYPETELVRERIDEQSARLVGQAIYQMLMSPRVAEERIDRIVDHLFMKVSRTELLSYTRLYSILARSLGHSGYVEMRQAARKNQGYVPAVVHSRAKEAIAFFAPPVPTAALKK